jgi:hypothetical protein
MLIGWGFLLSSGTLFAKFFKRRPDALWFRIHHVRLLACVLRSLDGSSRTRISKSEVTKDTTITVTDCAGASPCFWDCCYLSTQSFVCIPRKKRIGNDGPQNLENRAQECWIHCYLASGCHDWIGNNDPSRCGGSTAISIGVWMRRLALGLL